MEMGCNVIFKRMRVLIVILKIFLNKISTKQRRVDLLRIVRGRGSCLFFTREMIQFALLLKCGKFSPRNNF